MRGSAGQNDGSSISTCFLLSYLLTTVFIMLSNRQPTKPVALFYIHPVVMLINCALYPLKSAVNDKNERVQAILLR